MKDQNVNDIFQNDSGSGNKAKTILLLTIVMIILVVAFLIIAWVMTRGDTIETIEPIAEPKNQQVVNQPPYAYNMGGNDYNVEHTGSTNTESNNENALGLDPLNLNNTGLSPTPPEGAPALSLPPIPPKTIPPKIDTQHGNMDLAASMDSDPKLSAKLQELQQKHQDKSQLNANKDSKPKVEAPKIESPKVAEPAKDNKAQNSKQDSKVAAQPNQKDSQQKDTKLAEANKPNSKPQDTSKAQPAIKEPAKQLEAKKDDKKPQDTKLAEANKNNNVIVKKPAAQIEGNGKEAAKGHYIQVGSFTGSIDKNFLNKISKYPYRVKTESKDGKTIVKYLVGPYPSKVEANSNIQKIKEIQGGAFYVEIK